MAVLRDNTKDSGKKAEVTILREEDRGYTSGQRENQRGPALGPHPSGESVGHFPLLIPGEPNLGCPLCSYEDCSRRTVTSRTDVSTNLRNFSLRKGNKNIHTNVGKQNKTAATKTLASGMN